MHAQALARPLVFNAFSAAAEKHIFK